MADPLPPLTSAELVRYSRQILLEQFGTTGQQRLKVGRVLVVGAGGLGSPAALYLAAAGVGTIGIADFDTVEEHNLHRQLLHHSESVGSAKVRSAGKRLRATNPLVRVREHADGITAANAVELFGGYDVIVDGSDNFPTRYLNNDAAFFARKPVVHGSVFKFDGQVTVFDPARGGPCYRCLFPHPPDAGQVPACGEAGVLGAVCGVIGSLQAIEAIKLLAGVGTPLLGRIVSFHALDQTFDSARLPRDPACPLCGEHRTIRSIAATAACSAATPGSTSAAWPEEMTVLAAKQQLDAGGADVVLLDVRDPWETQICQVRGATCIPMREVPRRLSELPREAPILVMCHHGTRSQSVADYLRAQGYARVTNVDGGIAAWAEEIEPAMRRY